MATGQRECAEIQVNSEKGSNRAVFSRASASSHLRCAPLIAALSVRALKKSIFSTIEKRLIEIAVRPCGIWALPHGKDPCQWMTRQHIFY